jgi:hypothetical protein
MLYNVVDTAHELLSAGSDTAVPPPDSRSRPVIDSAEIYAAGRTLVHCGEVANQPQKDSAGGSTGTPMRVWRGRFRMSTRSELRIVVPPSTLWTLQSSTLWTFQGNCVGEIWMQAHLDYFGRGKLAASRIPASAGLRVRVIRFTSTDPPAGD